MTGGKKSPDEWRATRSKLGKLFVHDLKNPISALAANLSFIESVISEESESVRGAVSDSLLATQMLLRYAENLRLIAMLQAKEETPVSEVAIGSFVPALIHRLQPFAASADVTLEESGPAPRVDLTWQHQYGEAAVENLILSAIRHSKVGNVVRVGAATDEHRGWFVVRDAGSPVDPQRAQSLFSPEAQSEAKKNPSGRYGRGLGLYVAGLAAAALDGELSVSSDEHRTEITLTVPLHP